MQRLRTIIERVAASDRPVLVTGPTGAGKELVVREIHLRSRHPHPLLDVNCSAFPESLMESQLFGHERGAFTGAQHTQDGLMSMVGAGTLFLDEIGELSLPLQAKLLRVLETRTFRPLGSRSVRTLTGRIVAATHVDLERRVATGGFREDLLYRLNVLGVKVPALDERREDIPELVEHFLRGCSRDLRFMPDAIAMLQAAPWPGNVRQLRNLIERIDVLALDRVINAELLATWLDGKHPPKAEARATSHAPFDGLVRAVLLSEEGDKLRAVEAALLHEALRQAEGNKTEAARILGCHRKLVERRLVRAKRSEPLGALPDARRYPE